MSRLAVLAALALAVLCGCAETASKADSTISTDVDAAGDALPEADIDMADASDANADREEPEEVGLEDAPRPKLTSNRFEPPDGRVLHGAGQNLEYFGSYSAALSAETQPAVFMFYKSIKNPKATNISKGDFQAYLEKYPYAMPQIGLGLKAGGEAVDGAVAEGEYDEDIRNWATELKAVNRPVFVRIGFEFNGKHNGYSVEWYPKAFRRVVDIWREEGVSNVANVWCSTIGGNLLEWYPGDDYVDWWGWDKFYAAAPLPPAVQFMNDAMAHGKPVMIGEATPKGKDTHDGQPVWEKWFVPFFQMLEDWPAIKSINYINWDWEAVNPGKWKGWGIAQIEVNDFILEHYQQEIADPRFLHADKDLHALLGYE